MRLNGAEPGARRPAEKNMLEGSMRSHFRNTWLLACVLGWIAFESYELLVLAALLGFSFATYARKGAKKAQPLARTRFLPTLSDVEEEAEPQ